MADHVLDYSDARPSPAAMRAAGIVGVMRYLSGGHNLKDLTAAEAKALHDAGLTIGLVWETSAHRMDGGAAAGAADAKAANAQADALGFPDDRPIYFANDQNVCTQAHVDYLQAAKNASRRPVGPYGSTALIDAGARIGCRYGWKVATWGPPTANACLTQEPNVASPVPGTDMNFTHRDDWGQWPFTGAATPETEGDPDMWIMHGEDGPLKDEFWLVGLQGLERKISQGESIAHQAGGVKLVKMKQSPGYEVLPVAPKPSSGGATALNVSLTGTAKPA